MLPRIYPQADRSFEQNDFVCMFSVEGKEANLCFMKTVKGITLFLFFFMNLPQLLITRYRNNQCLMSLQIAQE